MESANIILIEKLQNMVSSVSSALSSGKFDKYENLKKYLTVEEILLSNHKKIIKQAKFSFFFFLRKAFGKQTKTIQHQAEEYVDALKSLESSDKQSLPIKDFISKEKLNPEILNELERIKEEEEKAERCKIIYMRYNETYDFRKFKTI